jgi:hypothetical protein
LPAKSRTIPRRTSPRGRRMSYPWPLAFLESSLSRS